MNKDVIKNSIIIVLILIIIVMGGFIICDKLLIEDKNNINKDNNSSSSLGNEQHNNDIVVNKFPDKNSDEVLLSGDLFYNLLNEEQRKLVDLNKNFNNVIFTINNIPISYNCLSFRNEEEDESLSRCTDAIVSINNHKLTINNWSLGCGMSRDIIYTDNYLIYRVISSCSQTGDIEIYDKNHNLLTKIDNVTTIIDNSYRLFNNKLYYVSYDTHGKDDSMGLYGDTDIYYTYIDLNDSNYKVHTFEKLERNN